MKTSKIKGLIKEAREDEALVSTININELLENLESYENDHIENKTLKTISEDIFNVVMSLSCPTEKKQSLLEKTTEYMYVSEINEIRKARQAYIIKKNIDNSPDYNPRIMHCLFYTLTFKCNSVYAMTKSHNHKWLTFPLDNYYIFQKLSDKEKLILMAYDKMENNEDLDELYEEDDSNDDNDIDDNYSR